MYVCVCVCVHATYRLASIEVSRIHLEALLQKLCLLGMLHHTTPLYAKATNDLHRVDRAPLLHEVAERQIKKRD